MKTIGLYFTIYYNKINVSGSDKTEKKQESLDYAAFRKWLIVNKVNFSNLKLKFSCKINFELELIS